MLQKEFFYEKYSQSHKINPYQNYQNIELFLFQPPLILWNAILAIFSILGFVFVTPTFLKVLREKGVQCTESNTLTLFNIFLNS